MGTVKYFRLRDGKATLFIPEREPNSLQRAVSEKELQTLCEKNLEPFFGVRFLQTEYPVIGGRADTLGLDGQNRPTIIEYKKGPNKYLINQTVYYSKCLQQFLRPAFEKKVRREWQNQKVNWCKAPRLICVAASFTEEDIVLQEMIETLELVRYGFLDKNRQELKLEWKPRAVPYGSHGRTLDDIGKNYLYWQNYIEGLGEEGTISEEFRSKPKEFKEAPHHAFYRQTKNGKRAGFAGWEIKPRSRRIKIWARKNFARNFYHKDSSWHWAFSDAHPDALETIKRQLRAAYDAAYESEADD